VAKTTVEIPDPLLRQAKAISAQRGISLKNFFTEAIKQQVRRSQAGGVQDEPWMQAFGGLRDLRRETRRIQRIIDEEFEQIEEEDWR
jgi:hypothetical protein